MKKNLFILAILITLAACSRQADDAPEPPTNTFFSQVTRWKDNRTPAVDTVWTLHLFSQNMVDSFRRYDGYIYFESNTYRQQGVMWSK